MARLARRAPRFFAWLVAGMLLATATSLPAQPGAPASQIAFVSPYERTRQIFVVNPVGGGLRRVTGPPGDNEGPAWSPDGKRLLFVRTESEKTQIYTLSADGMGLTRLTAPPQTHAEPAWSPDGHHIAFITQLAGVGRVSVMTAEGGEQQSLTEPLGSESAPSWSPDGHLIAFLAQSKESGAELYLMGADFKNVHKIPTPPTGLTPGVTEFVWLQDGQQIAYTTRAGPAQSDISIASLAGGTPRWLAFGHTPSWSPDGKRVAFVVAHVGGGQVYLQDLTTRQSVPLTDGRFISMRPTWSPDGRWIAFLSIRGTDLALWVMRADGSEQRRLAPASGNLSVLPVISWTQQK